METVILWVLALAILPGVLVYFVLVMLLVYAVLTGIVALARGSVDNNDPRV